MKAFSPKKIAVLGVLTTLSLLAFLLESLLPPIFVPGAKAGLSNLFSTLTLVAYGVPEGFLVLTVRILLGAVFGGNIGALIYSLPAGLLSFTVFALLWVWKKGKVSLFSLCILSAVIHNAVQLFAHCLIVSTLSLLSYAPALILCGAVAGAIVGALAETAIRYIPSAQWDKLY